MKKKKKKIIAKLRNKYRLVVMNDATMEEKTSFTLTRMNVITGFSTLLVFFTVLITSMLFYTPLKEYIPGYNDGAEQTREIIRLSAQKDSLEDVVRKSEQWREMIQGMLEGRVDTLGMVLPEMPDSGTAGTIAAGPGEAELALRRDVEASGEKPELRGGALAESWQPLMTLPFFSPMKGWLTDTFNMQEGHYAVDVAGDENSAVKATLRGTVVLASWTPETGHVMILQHENDLLSVYKHNSVLLKKVGNFVDAGEVIALVGNSGELSTGHHLHFELWHRGLALNPRDFVLFN